MLIKFLTDILYIKILRYYYEIKHKIQLKKYNM